MTAVINKEVYFIILYGNWMILLLITTIYANSKSRKIMYKNGFLKRKNTPLKKECRI